MSDSIQRKAARHVLALTVTALAVLVCTSAQAAPETAKPATGKTKTAPVKAKATPAKANARSHAPNGTKPKAAAGAAAPEVTSAKADDSRSRSPVRQADYIVALVNSEPITNNELRARMTRARQQLAERNVAEPSEGELRKQVLEIFISERAQLQLAKELSIEVDQLTLSQAEESVAQQNNLPSAAALHIALQREGVSTKDFRADLQRQILLQRLRERMIEPRIKVTDADIDRFLRDQMAQQGFQAKPEINLAMILVRVPEGSSAAETAKLRERAEDAAKRAQAGEDFAKLATEYSQSTNQGKDGGELGLRAVDMYPALFTSATAKLNAGQVTGVVRSDAGFHVLKVIERKRGAMPTMTVPQIHARHILLTVKPGQDENLALQRLRDFKRRVESGQGDFAALARENSQDASAADGGDLGWANPGQFVPEFEQVMNGLAPGQVGEPLRSRFGLHLIQVLERRDHPLTEADQRSMARNMLRERKNGEEFETWAKEVRARAFVELRDAPH